MQVDEARAKALGWPKQRYAWIERERRWLCDALPTAMVVRAEQITDLYVTGTQLRLREAVAVVGGEPMRRLGRKADVDASTRLLTSIYLSPEEFRLPSDLPGKRLRKTRHALAPMGGHAMSVDTFEGPLAGLIMAEVEFESDESMAAFLRRPSSSAK
jgi:CYTH domain-containing protein